MTTSLVELTVEEPAWEAALPDLETVADQATRAALAGVGLAPDRYSVSLLACDDARIAALNGVFRGKEAPTNVLSWPALPLAPASPGAAPPRPPEGSDGDPFPLGDVAIALQTCQQEAHAASKPLKNHTMHLILHGVLHLLGYDHETEDDAGVMERIEREALGKLGIPDPYE